MKIERSNLDSYDYIKVIFKNKNDLISYLKTASTRSDLLPIQCSSMGKSTYITDFTGTETFDEALNLFQNGWFEGFENFLTIKKFCDRLFPSIKRKSSLINSYEGSRPNVFNAINNMPMTMKKKVNTNPTNIIKLNIMSSTPWWVKQEEIYINGAITLSLMDFLSTMGYRVDFQVCALSTKGNQIVNIDSCISECGESINIQKLYMPLCHSSFLRRLIFRVEETISEIDKSYYGSYGKVIEYNKIKNLLYRDENNILIGSPEDMGIAINKSCNIFEMIDTNEKEDFIKKMENYIENYLRTIELDKYINVDSSLIKDDNKILSRVRNI